MAKIEKIKESTPCQKCRYGVKMELIVYSCMPPCTNFLMWGLSVSLEDSHIIWGFLYGPVEPSTYYLSFDDDLMVAYLTDARLATVTRK